MFFFLSLHDQCRCVSVPCTGQTDSSLVSFPGPYVHLTLLIFKLSCLPCNMRGIVQFNVLFIYVLIPYHVYLSPFLVFILSCCFYIILLLRVGTLSSYCNFVVLSYLFQLSETTLSVCQQLPARERIRLNTAPVNAPHSKMTPLTSTMRQVKGQTGGQKQEVQRPLAASIGWERTGNTSGKRMQDEERGRKD